MKYVVMHSHNKFGCYCDYHDIPTPLIGTTTNDINEAYAVKARNEEEWAHDNWLFWVAEKDNATV